MTTFAQGPGQLLSGFKLLLRPGVRKYVLIPFFLNTFLFAGIIYFGASSLNDLINWLTSNWTWTEWVSWLLWPVFALVSLAIVFFSFSIIANLIAAPFNGFLSDAVARELNGSHIQQGISSASISEEIWKAFRSESQKMTYFLIRAIPLLILFFIPFVQAFAPLIWFIFGAWMLSLEYMEYPMGNRGMLFPEVREEVASQRLLTLSFGGSVMLLTMIPVLNFLVMPAAVAAATKLYLEEYDAHSKISSDMAK